MHNESLSASWAVNTIFESNEQYQFFPSCVLDEAPKNDFDNEVFGPLDAREAFRILIIHHPDVDAAKMPDILDRIQH
jgi:hypothetical protein